MSEDIDIKIREDGSRVVARNLDDAAKKADAANKSIKDLNKTVGDGSSAESAMVKLKSLIRMAENYGNGLVKSLDQSTSSYRNSLMKHFEMVSRNAKASASSIKSQMEAITAAPVNMDVMNNFYRQQEALDKGYTAFLASELAAREALERSSADARFAAAIKKNGARAAAEEDYTKLWSTMLSSREKMEADSIVASVRNLRTLETAEQKSNAERLKIATQTITTRTKAESNYTSWWIAELSKRDAATAASALRNAQQRSGMQAFSSERLDRQLIAPAPGTSATAKMYAKDDVGNLGAKTAAQTAEYQLMQRQMAMMQLMLPMAERQNMLDAEAEASTKRLITAKTGLVNTHGQLATNTRNSGNSQAYWNVQAREGHAFTRGLSGALGQLWLTYGAILPLMAGAALGSAFVNAAKAGSELAYSLQFVKSLGGEATEAIEELRKSALDLAKGSQYAPVEIADGYRILAQAGLNAADALRVMPDVLNLATAGEMSMEQAGLALVGVLNAFNLNMDQSTHVSDVFAKAAAVSQTSVVQMTEAMKTASTVGQQYKQSMEGTASALALLAKLNITGTAAGTSYRNMLKSLYTPTEAVGAEMKRLGIATEETIIDKFGKSTQKVRDFADVVFDLRKKMDTLDEPSQLRLTGFLGNERGSKELVAMLNLGREEWDKFYNEIANKSDGFSKKVAQGQNETVQGTWKIALNNMQSALADAYNSMEPRFLALSQTMKNLFAGEEFKSGVTNVVNGLLTILESVVTLTPYLFEMAKAWVVLKSATMAFAAVQAIIAVFTAIRTAVIGTQVAMATFSAVSAGLATTLTGGTGVIAALGLLSNPLGWIIGLLTAGAAAWVLWGNSAETASAKAIKSAQSRIDQLKQEQKFGVGELAAERAKLADQEAALSQARKKMEHDAKIMSDSSYANRDNRQAIQKGPDLSILQAGIDKQKELVGVLESRQKAATDLADAAKLKDPWMQPKPDANTESTGTFGTGTWNVPKPAAIPKGPSGRLNDDDNALAKLEAKLQASKEEYKVILQTGDAQYRMNAGQEKALEIQTKISELSTKSDADLLERGLAGRAEQLKNFEAQLSVAQKLGIQIQENEKLKVNVKLDEEVRLVQLLPIAREEENKFIAFKNELLGKSVVLSTEEESSLRNRINAQIQLNKEMAVRDSYLANSKRQTLRDNKTDAEGIRAAMKTPDWANQDTSDLGLKKMQSIGVDTSLMDETLSSQKALLDAQTVQLEEWHSLTLISDEQFRMAKEQLRLKYQDAELSSTNNLFSQLASLQSSGNSRLASIGRAAAIAQATMDGVVAVQKAYAGSPYPWNIAAAAAQAAISAANVAKLSGLNFATGGSFVVGGTGGIDSQNVSFRASPGERVSIATPTQVRKGTESQNNSQQTTRTNVIHVHLPPGSTEETRRSAGQGAREGLAVLNSASRYK